MAHPSPIHSWKLIFPCVVSAVKLGASELMRKDMFVPLVSISDSGWACPEPGRFRGLDPDPASLALSVRRHLWYRRCSTLCWQSGKIFACHPTFDASRWCRLTFSPIGASPATLWPSASMAEALLLNKCKTSHERQISRKQPLFYPEMPKRKATERLG